MTTKDKMADLWERFSEATCRTVDHDPQKRSSGLKDLKRITNEAEKEIKRLKAGGGK